jgi:hypothetical protein
MTLGGTAPPGGLQRSLILLMGEPELNTCQQLPRIIRMSD